ncbi:MAG TPA: CocE/NonD family hydrolase [Stellaceae bacterium]|nr:CocE/NonD family hydrolase [Stellaceae bacterium]
MIGRAAPKDLLFERDVPVRMRDGAHLMANVFRAPGAARTPALMSVTPYGKDKLPDRIGMTIMRLAGVRFGRIETSRYTGFEAPDPVYWVRNGYAVVQADVRGMHKSEGNAGVLTDQDAEDYYDLIEWAAAQEWCDGGVALSGVSYLAMSQWRVAALKPPHLKAIIPWEGVSDLYREFAFHGGIPETGFIPIWWKNRMVRGRNRRFPFADDFLENVARHPLDDEYWAGNRAALERIEVPALVCASWSDQGLHTRGSIEGFSRIASPQKWLYTHGRRKWEAYYSEDGQTTQKRFLDHFLKGADNGWPATPRVRLEVRSAFGRHSVRSEDHWPPASTRLVKLFLECRTGRLQSSEASAEGSVSYDAASGRAVFAFPFERDTELTGEMALRLWVSTSEGDDLDLFVVLRKFDAAGREVFFPGYNGFARDAVAKGWLRVSHRALDPAKSRPSRPWHTHARLDTLRPGEIVPIDIEILPSSTLFEAGTRLELSVQGRDGAKYPVFKHRASANRGAHTLHCGGRFDSHLLVPIASGGSA